MDSPSDRRLSAFAAFRAAVGDVPLLDDPALVRQRSRDVFGNSPRLKADSTARAPTSSPNPDGVAIVIAMMAEPSLATVRLLLARAGGRLTCEAPSEEGPGTVPLHEYTWNHMILAGALPRGPPFDAVG